MAKKYILAAFLVLLILAGGIVGILYAAGVFGGGGPQVLKLSPQGEEKERYVDASQSPARLVTDRSSATRVIRENTQRTIQGNTVFRLRLMNNSSTYLVSNSVFEISKNSREVYTIGTSSSTQQADWYVDRGTLVSATDYSKNNNLIVGKQ